MADRRSFGKKLSHAIEGGAGWLCYAFFRALPLDWASALGGWLASSIGPHVGASKRARLNLRRAMPDLTEAEVKRVVRGMWDNLGRVAAEFPHIGRFKIDAPDGRIAVERFLEIVDGRKPDTRFIFFSGHYGNWEIATYVVTQCGLDVIEVYRAANNPFIDRIITRARGVIGSELVPKGAVATKRALAAMQEGRHICMLVDQKMNDGMAVPFFGRDAMTAPALARLALRYDCTVVPCWVERIAGTRFRFIAEEPLTLPKSGDLQADTLALMTAVNAAVERRVRRHPEQWFWLHRRWPD